MDTNDMRSPGTQSPSPGTQSPSPGTQSPKPSAPQIVEEVVEDSMPAESHPVDQAVVEMVRLPADEIVGSRRSRKRPPAEATNQEHAFTKKQANRSIANDPEEGGGRIDDMTDILGFEATRVINEKTVVTTPKEYLKKELKGGLLRSVTKERITEMHLAVEGNMHRMFNYVPLEVFYSGDSFESASRLAIMEGNSRSLILLRLREAHLTMPTTLTVLSRQLDDGVFNHLFEVAHPLTSEIIDKPPPDVQMPSLALLLSQLHGGSGLAVEKSGFTGKDEVQTVYRTMSALFPKPYQVAASVQKDFARIATKEGKHRLTRDFCLPMSYFCAEKTKEQFKQLFHKGRVVPSHGHICEFVVVASQKDDSLVASVIRDAVESDEPWKLSEWKAAEKTIRSALLEAVPDEVKAKRARNAEKKRRSRMKQKPSVDRVEESAEVVEEPTEAAKVADKPKPAMKSKLANTPTSRMKQTPSVDLVDESAEVAEEPTEAAKVADKPKPAMKSKLANTPTKKSPKAVVQLAGASSTVEETFKMVTFEKGEMNESDLVALRNGDLSSINNAAAMWHMKDIYPALMEFSVDLYKVTIVRSFDSPNKKLDFMAFSMGGPFENISDSHAGTWIVKEKEHNNLATLFARDEILRAKIEQWMDNNYDVENTIDRLATFLTTKCCVKECVHIEFEDL